MTASTTRRRAPAGAWVLEPLIHSVFRTPSDFRIHRSCVASFPIDLRSFTFDTSYDLAPSTQQHNFCSDLKNPGDNPIAWLSPIRTRAFSTVSVNPASKSAHASCEIVAPLALHTSRRPVRLVQRLPVPDSQTPKARVLRIYPTSAHDLSILTVNPTVYPTDLPFQPPLRPW